MIRLAILIVGGEVVAEGDYLVHSEGGARTQRGPLAAGTAFARVIDPTPGEKASDGSYRVKCELITARPYVPKASKEPATCA